ncbi:MAG: thrombospondin type 3 repeat-containing protein [Bacteroidales bacterium]|nr:thrombospondin type 3 repeat-containing protein [Bacteroidales bacterium]
MADYLDQCPGTPAEAIGKVDVRGCPTDIDGDGVYDYEDFCPQEPGIKENKGCPAVK